jgi:uncharacterized coiled-coil protein SlyX
MSDTNEREEFEADAIPYGYDFELANCGCCTYKQGEANHRWYGWQARGELEAKKLEDSDARYQEQLATYQARIKFLEENALSADRVEAALNRSSIADEKRIAEQQARVRELEEALQLVANSKLGHTESPCLNVRSIAAKALSTTTLDTALQKALLEARIDEVELAVAFGGATVSRVEELRAQLAALGE